MGGIISPLGVLILTTLYITLVITAIYLIIKNEEKLLKVIWVLVVFIFPLVGPLVYLGKYLIEKKKPSKA